MTEQYRSQRLQQITAVRGSIMRDFIFSLLGIIVMLVLFYVFGMLH